MHSGARGDARAVGCRTHRNRDHGRSPGALRTGPEGRSIRLNPQRTSLNALATLRQHCCPCLDLRADRLRLCADLPGEPRAQSRPWRVDDAGRLCGAGDGLAIQRAPGNGTRRGRPPEPVGRRAGLRLSHAQDDRRDGAGSHPHDGSARHPDPRAGGAGVVGAAAISGAGAWRAQPVAGCSSAAGASRCGRRCWC